MANKCIRHGEALLKPVNKKVNGEAHTSYVIAHSESGHNHVLQSKKPFKVSESDKQFLIELFEPATLTHLKTYDRHKDLTIPAGTYEIIHKKEYDPFEKIMREVWD